MVANERRQRLIEVASDHDIVQRCVACARRVHSEYEHWSRNLRRMLGIPVDGQCRPATDITGSRILAYSAFGITRQSSSGGNISLKANRSRVAQSGNVGS
jgi:hypothetical protein